MHWDVFALFIAGATFMGRRYRYATCVPLIVAAMMSSPIHAVTPVEFYYSSHNNSVHDAGSDMKHLLLQAFHHNGAAVRTRYFVSAAAITPPNGRQNPIAGRTVRRMPSNQLDTYVVALGAGRHYGYMPGSGATVDITLGAINGFAETLVRGSITRIHEAGGLTNLRHSPTTSSYRPYLALAVGNANTLYPVTSRLSLHGMEHVQLGNLSVEAIAGLYLQYGAPPVKTLPVGLPTSQWSMSQMTFFGGVYTRVVAYDLPTNRAGTQYIVPYGQAGAVLPIAKAILSLKYTYYTGPLVRQQFTRTDDYIEVGFGYRF